jgi:hypothetical protein
MESTAWSAETREALAAVAASIAALTAALDSYAGGGAGRSSLSGSGDACPSGSDDAGSSSGSGHPRPSGAGPLSDDPLRDLADASLDGLAGAARVEAGFAALKVLLTADYARATRAQAPPAASARDRSVQEMVMVSEVACALTVSESSAGALLGESEALTARCR